MSARAGTRLAWSLCALTLTLTVPSLLLLVLNLRHPGAYVFDYWAEATVMALAFPMVGAFIASRRPENPVGWLFCVMGFLAGIDHFCAEYAIYALLAQPGSLPLGEAGAWVRSWVWVAYIGLGMFLVVLFPDGRLPSSRWRSFAWLSATVTLLGAIAVALSPGPVDGLGPIENPLGVEALGIGGAGDVDALVEALLFVPLASVAAASLLVRLRRSRGMERQQVKWFAYAEVVLVIGTILAYTASDVMGVPWWVWWTGFLLTIVGLVGLPVGMGIAIFRYRLYDIDLLINRTLVYGTLTATLALVYFGSVVVLQRIFVFVAGEGSQLVIVASTLTIAALFVPLRRRIQGFIDRRFYRNKYDAARTLSEFSARLRDETDLDALSGELVNVVRETVQPERASLWLRPPAGRGADG